MIRHQILIQEMLYVLEVEKKQLLEEDNVFENVRLMPTASAPGRDVFVMVSVDGVVLDLVSYFF